jgi:hypothetical protein
MENQTAPDIQTRATLRIWDRSARAEKEMPVNVAERSVALGLADLIRPEALPFDKAARAGGPTAGDGEGFAFVVPVYAPTTTIKVSLLTALRMVRNHMATYATPSGSAPAIDREPVIVA